MEKIKIKITARMKTARKYFSNGNFWKGSFSFISVVEFATIFVVNSIQGSTVRGPRTKTGWSQTERFGPGPVQGAKFRNLGPDQDQKNFESLGPMAVRGSLIPSLSVWWFLVFLGLLYLLQSFRLKERPLKISFSWKFLIQNVYTIFDLPISQAC